MRTLTAPAVLTSISQAIQILKGEIEGDGAAATAAVLEHAKSSVEHVALRWHERGNLRRWFDLDDLFQELRVVLLSRCVRGFNLGLYSQKGDKEVARIFGRFVIVSLNNFLLDTYRHSCRNWTLRVASLDGAHDSRTVHGNAAEMVQDDRDYSNEPGGVDEREMFGALRKALTEDQAKIAYLLYEGHTWEEIGAIVGENAGTLRERMKRRGTPVLRSLLARWGS